LFSKLPLLFSTVQAGGKPFPWLHLAEEKEKKRKKTKEKKRKPVI
jgi:hypothetical protein